VGVAICYGMDGPGIEIQRERDCQYLSRQALGSLCLLYNAYRLSFPGVMRSERGLKHPPPSSVKVKERLVPLWAFIACSWAKFTL
jgi:hypothetical protein